MTAESTRDREARIADELAIDLLDDEAHAPGGDILLARRLAMLGIAGVMISTAAIGVLHVVEPSRSLDPLSRTISEYELLSNGWIFDWGVVVLALASALILGAMVVREMVPLRSWGSMMTLLWCIGLVGLVVFPKHPGLDPSVAGRVHWTWTLIAFFSLPIGTCLICWRHRTPTGRWPRSAIRLSMMAGGWFAVLTVQTVLSAVTPIQAWRAVGLVERALSLTEMAVMVVLGLWVVHHSESPAVLDPAPDVSG
ncbi:DUF998 domain-containing protein [Nakamurella sp. PAMC28650]|uniref:DUF998 domain-containing protein n=1 Tax=Nakamurella sp. PAMC28650 TaxID=2762325 RepID=UPI00164CF685|nr:DUF998 domain-containing protein [Nakamurella sp. PAMC28650]QNK79871.1 DUF998 domain-containing protein [Nakamurella sp. PAMC28650]